MAWYNASWDYRIKITTQNAKVAADTSNPTLYVNLDNLPDDFFTNVKSDGGDIRVTSGDGTTELPIEVVWIDTTAKTGQLHFRVSGTLSGSSDTDFYIYYGNSGASLYAEGATYGKHAVWPTSEYDIVMHLQENGNTSAGGYVDSTANSYDGTGVSMTSSSDVDAFLGKGQDFDGSSDYIKFGDVLDKTSDDPITMLFWLNVDKVSGTQMIFGKQDATDFKGYIQWLSSSYMATTISAYPTGYIEIAWPSISANTNYYIQVSYQGDAVGSNVVGMRNGSTQSLTVNNDNLNGATSLNTPAEINIASRLNGALPLDGTMDEVYLINDAWDINRMTTNYNNMGDNSTFFSWGTQETDAGGGVEVDLTTQTNTLSILTPSVQTGASYAPNQLVLSNTILEPTISIGVVEAVSTLTHTYSLLPPTVTTVSIGYSRGVEVSLPTGTGDLGTIYTGTDNTDVGEDDGDRVGVTGQGFLIHLFKYNHTNNTDPITIGLNLQSTLAPSSSSVVLQAYNNDTTSWETLTSNTTANANEDFDLNYVVSPATDYYGTNNLIAIRVYQEV